MSQFSPYDEIEMWHGHPDKSWNWLDEILNTPDDNEIGYFLEVDLKYPDDIKQKTKYFPFCPENCKQHKLYHSIIYYVFIEKVILNQ